MGNSAKLLFTQGEGNKGRRMGVLEIAARAFLTAVAAAAALMILLYVFKDRLLFFPDRGPHLTGPPAGSGLAETFLDGGAGAEVNAWFAPAPPGGRTVLLFHGNAGSVADMQGRMKAIRDLGMGVFAVDYNGYGRSGGKPSERALELNAEAAWNRVVGEGVAPADIVIWGYSMGGYPASDLAFRHRERRNPLVLDSTFTRVADAAAAYGLLLKLAGPPVLGDSFDVKRRLLALKAEAVLVFHSPEDDVVAYRLGVENYESYGGGPKEFVKLVGSHKDFDLNRAAYQEALARQLKLDGGVKGGGAGGGGGWAEGGGAGAAGGADDEGAADERIGEPGGGLAAGAGTGEAGTAEAATGESAAGARASR
jgi:pimeloyl-ACP methyl ester carboxylesterase